MKWIGQHIWDFYSRFRNDVYLESLTTTTDVISPPKDVFLVILPSESTTRVSVSEDVDKSSRYTSSRNLDMKLQICCPIHFII